MNVAEDVRYAFARKSHFLRASGFIEAEIESPAVEKRKHVVKERVGIGKAHNASYRNHQQMRRERSILLEQYKAARRRWLHTGGFVQRLEPQNGRRSMLLRRLRRWKLNAGMKLRGQR